MVRIGIIGLGPYWEQRYEPALRAIDQRIQIKAVYDPVRSRAEQVAAHWNAAAVSGIGCLVSRYSIDAFLLLHSDWMNHYPLKLLSQQHRPVYIAGSLGEDLDLLELVHARAADQLVTLMPEFSRRYSQATSRFFELVVTRLGKPNSIQIETCCPAADQQVEVPGQKNETDFLVGLMDWCCYVMRTKPVKVQTTLHSDSSDRSEDHRQIKIEFLPDPVTAAERFALIKIKIQQRETETLFPRHQINCQNGLAEFHSPDEIHWENESASMTESLKSDRRELEVMLDHFCRRAVGGIIPVPSIRDACQAIQLVRLSRESLSSGKSLEVTTVKDWD
ncbi:Gfo/Idh/MocA family oxidoreductase [uncultured Gimesia sp.]|uniref:Gfo/Idh/MocA family oxidoreductase n=1 Tax=uncultured Gimesia sp. TaxID=1678688 RepID=UPI0030DAC3FA|tara:strand:- start:21946 stop:22944 length:999 start_codon:yes stop_codon:yes gene_type:complete